MLWGILVDLTAMAPHLGYRRLSAHGKAVLKGGPEREGGTVWRRWWRRRRSPEPYGLQAVPDDVPKRHRFSEPVTVARLEAESVDPADGGVQVTFLVEVRDARGAPCPELAVEARLEGPERTGGGMGQTDERGQLRFRTTGPHGRYRLEVVDVGAGAINLDLSAGDHLAALNVEL